MAEFFALLFLLFLILWPVSIFKPELFKKLFRETTRKKNALLFGGLTLLFFTLTGITAPETTQKTVSIPTSTIAPTQSAKAAETTPTSTPTNTPTPKPTNSPVPTRIPTLTPKPTIYIPIATPTIYHAPTLAPRVQQNSGGSWPCDCTKTCPEISSCAEAQYLLNTCGCGARDADKDGIACDGAPLHCQN